MRKAGSPLAIPPGDRLLERRDVGGRAQHKAGKQPVDQWLRAHASVKQLDLIERVAVLGSISECGRTIGANCGLRLKPGKCDSAHRRTRAGSGLRRIVSAVAKL